MPDLTPLVPVVEVVLAFLSAYFVAFWVGLILWTVRDIRSRTRDILVQLMATILVVVFGLPGLFLYWLLRPAETLAAAYDRALEEEAIMQDLEERAACPGCKQAIQSDFVLCPNCKTKLRNACASCGRLMNLKWTVCPYCGQGQAT
jgi:RNA polymerase subunit RPABC4/transcription elongation factor Spt4